MIAAGTACAAYHDEHEEGGLANALASVILLARPDASAGKGEP
jgi:hypothetical protein